MEGIKQTHAEFLETEQQCQMKNALDKINGRLDIAEEKIREFEGIVIEIIHNKMQKERIEL